MLWMNQKLGAMFCTNQKLLKTLGVLLYVISEYLKSDVRWIIHLRLYSGP